MSPEAAVIKHYQIISCLGQGGFGRVFEAWDSKLQRRVAIKCLNADGLLSPAADLTREARMAASLNHAAFVKIHALEDDDNSQAIVMELVKGETLKQIITNKKFDLSQTLNIIRQIAEAMQQAHDVGLTHGDLKPSNLMLEPTGQVRILDFGLASMADTQATTSMLQQDPQGTIAYMAPERLLGAPLNPSIDVYALGVIFYELLNGQRPFAELSGLALAAALVQSSSDQWNYPQDLSPALIHIIRRMTIKQNAQRIASMSEVLIELDAFDQGIDLERIPAQADVNATAPKNMPSPQHRGHKHLKNAVLLSLLIISCIVFGGWFTRNVLWHFEEVIPRYSESQEMKLGMDALEQWDRPGSLDVAIKHFNNLAEQNPENAAAIAGLSIAYSLKYQGDTQDKIWLKRAIASAQTAIRKDSMLALSHIALGRVLYAQGKYDKALESYNHALALNSDSKFGLHGKINDLIRLGRYEEALALANNSLLRFPENRNFTDQIGVIYVDQGKYKEAEDAFRKSISIQPDCVFAYANLSAVLQYQGRSQDALNILQKGLELRPSAWLYTNLGNIFFLNGDYLKAVDAFEMAVSPQLGNSDDYISWANLADVLLLIPGRKEEAKKYYRKAIQLLEPRLNEGMDDMQRASRMALYLARVGDKILSKKKLDAILHRDSMLPDVRFRLGLSYELIGERLLALEQIHMAAKLGYPRLVIEAEPDLEPLRRDSRYVLR